MTAPACDKCNDQAGGCWYCGQADDPRAWQAQRAIEESRMRAALRANRGGGGHHDPEPRMGLVTAQGAGGTRSTPCDKCNDQAGGCWYCGRG